MSGLFDGLSGLFSGAGGLASTAKLASAFIGAGASIYGGIQQSKAAKKNADLARKQSAFDADKARKNTRRLTGQQRANYAAAGIQIEGSPALLIEETEQLGEDEAQNILEYGDARADAYKSQSSNALIGGLLGGGAGLLGGYAQNKLFTSQLEGI